MAAAPHPLAVWPTPLSDWEILHGRRCHLGADEDEKEYFKEVEMAQALGQAHEAFGLGVHTSSAAPLTALAPCNSNTQAGGMMESGGVGATPGPSALPGTPLSAATPLVNSSMFGANAPVTPWTGPHSNSMQATPVTGGHGGNGSGALSFATPSSASFGGMMGGEQTPDMPSGMHTPSAMGPPPLPVKGPAPPRRGRMSTGVGDTGGHAGRSGAMGSLGFGVVRSLDGENTDPLNHVSTPGPHAGASSNAMPAPVSATRRVTRSSTANATSSSAVGAITLPLGNAGERSSSGSGAPDETAAMEEDPPPHKKKPHLQQSGMGTRQSQNWQAGLNSWSVSCQSPRIQDQASASMPPMPGDTSEICSLFRQLANAYRHLCMFRSHEAIKSFAELPKCQYNTGWVQAQVATVSPRPPAACLCLLFLDPRKQATVEMVCWPRRCVVEASWPVLCSRLRCVCTQDTCHVLYTDDICHV